LFTWRKSPAYSGQCQYSLSACLHLAIDKGFKDYQSLTADPDLLNLPHFEPFIDLVKK
jgi:hypothetical protein